MNDQIAHDLAWCVILEFYAKQDEVRISFLTRRGKPLKDEAHT